MLKSSAEFVEDPYDRVLDATTTIGGQNEPLSPWSARQANMGSPVPVNSEIMIMIIIIVITWPT